MSDELSHLDASGRPRMVDVGGKEPSRRRAIARGRLRLSESGWRVLAEGGSERKGDPLTTAQVAAVQACKRCADWIPMAHPLPLESVELRWTQHADARVLELEVEVSLHGRTGVEMEALTGVSAGLLTVYDMLKAVDRSMILGPVWLHAKEGGRSGSLQFDDPPLL